MSSFEIDFFELSFLAEACIPPRPIARSMFWSKMIDVYYDQMTTDERERILEWLQHNGNFDRTNDDIERFFCRYDKDHQYKITTVFKGKKETKDAYLFQSRYMIGQYTSINEDYITKIEKQ